MTIKICMDFLYSNKKYLALLVLCCNYLVMASLASSANMTAVFFIVANIYFASLILCIKGN